MSRGTTELVDLLVHLSRATTVRAMYPEGHPSVDRAVSDLEEALDRSLARRGTDEITYLVIDEDVVVDDRPLRTKSMHLRPFVRTMNRLGIQRLSLARGLGVEEANDLLTALASGGDVPSSDHVVVGQIFVGDGDSAGDREGGELAEGDLDRGGDAFARFSRDPGESVERLDRLVWRVMEGLAGASRSLLLLPPVQGFDQALFYHSVNVSMLAVALARSLGIEGGMLHEIGLAAMLHDIGKTALPRELWRGRERLSEEEWRMARLHPELGAAMLAGTEGVPTLAILVAYEHHLRWDGEPSYPRCKRSPSFASQITAVADTWDTLSAGRELLGAPARRAALRVWRERSGTRLDPFLVGQFLLLMSEAGEGPG